MNRMREDLRPVSQPSRPIPVSTRGRDSQGNCGRLPQKWNQVQTAEELLAVYRGRLYKFLVSLILFLVLLRATAEVLHVA
jgi:hypothetical protein